MEFATEQEVGFVQKGEQTIKELLNSNELIGYEIMKKNILNMKPIDYEEHKKYDEWLTKIALKSKHHNIRLMAIEKLYKKNDIDSMENVIKKTKDKKLMRICANLILESCKEYYSPSTLNTIAHKMGIGTGGIKVKPKDWKAELKNTIKEIKDYNLKKEIAQEYHNINF